MKSAVKTRFSVNIVTHEANEEKLGPVAILIAVYPGSTSADTAHGVSQDTLKLLKENEVEDVEVEWLEAILEMMRY